MISFIARYFSSLWELLTAPFRLIWRGIAKLFPPRDCTIMDTRDGEVITYQQSSFWRFTKFCGKIGLVIWATWSTYVFVYHRPMLQKRTAQLEEMRATHDRHMADLQTYLNKFNELTRNLNVTDDKILHADKLTAQQKEDLLNSRLKTWGELDFLRTRLTEMFTNADYAPEYTKMAELSAEYEITRAENEALRKQSEQIAENVQMIADADSKIVDTVSKITSENIDDLRQQMKKINSTITSLGLNEKTLVEKANKYSSPTVGSAFNPMEMDKNIDPKYKKLADGLELWNGLAKLMHILPIGAPVQPVHVTSNYGMRQDPFTGKQKQHRGIDFAGKIGTELMAVAPGRVISAGERVGYGLTVEIDHGLGFTTLYAHLSAAKVARGDWVRPGTVVGLGGSSGRSTGPHLHYEIRYKGDPFNPSKFVKE